MADGEHLGVGTEALADHRWPFGRLVDFDEEQRRGFARVDDDELVGVDAVAEVGDHRLRPPELDEPPLLTVDTGDELHTVELVADGYETGRSIWVEVKATSSGFTQAISHGDSSLFGG